MRAKYLFGDFEGAKNFFTPKFSWRPQEMAYYVFYQLQKLKNQRCMACAFATICSKFYRFVGFVFIVFWWFFDNAWNIIYAKNASRILKEIRENMKSVRFQIVP